MAITYSSFAMRCTRRSVTLASLQKCTQRSQRSYNTILKPSKYTNRLVYLLGFENEYFPLSHLENRNPSFSITTSLLQHVIVDQKSLLARTPTIFYESAFKVLDKMVQEKSQYNYSHAYTFEQKLSLYLLLKHVRWDGTIEESQNYPDNCRFPLLINEKEVILSVTAMYDSRKSRDIGLDAFYISGDCEKDSEHNEKIMKEYAQLFEGKL